MNTDKNSNALEIILKEYEKLKDEQTQRIGFRDNILYVTLVSIGGVISFGMGAAANHFALLLLPLISIILGWTYLMNDEKISSIGKYIRENLNHAIHNQIEGGTTFGWEFMHRTDKNRVSRKAIQFIIDELAFCVSGIVSVTAFIMLDKPQLGMVIVCTLEILALIGLGIEIAIYADFKEGNAR